MPGTQDGTYIGIGIDHYTWPPQLVAGQDRTTRGQRSNVQATRRDRSKLYQGILAWDYDHATGSVGVWVRTKKIT